MHSWIAMILNTCVYVLQVYVKRLFFNVEIRKNRGADWASKAEAKNDLPRRGLQWKTHKNCTISWQEVPSFC